MDSERYKILKRITIVTGICAVVFFAVAFAVPTDAFASAKEMRIAFTIVGAACLCAFCALLTKVIENKGTASGNNERKKKREFTDEQLSAWLSKFEKFSKCAAELTATKKNTFTKFGGMPTVSKDFEWARSDGKPIPFLLQIDFQEVNPDGRIENFPTSGLMYVFVDSDKVNFVDAPIDSDYEYHEGETFKILFAEKPSDLSEAAKPADLQDVYKEIHLSSSITKTYPDTDDCDEALEIYRDRPCEDMDDAYDRMRYDATGIHSVGGWATYVQGGGFVNKSNGNGEDWTLLMQIGSEDGDEKFMWGDVGTLYFYIRESDLVSRKFDNVKLDMQCT